MYVSSEPIALKHWYDLFVGLMYALYLLIGWMGLYFGFHFLRSQPERTRDRPARHGVGAIRATEDAALSTQSPFFVQHPYRQG